MSQFGGHSDSPSQLSEPLPSRSKFEAEESAMEMIERVIERVINHIVRGERLRVNLKHFSNMKAINNINEVNRLNLYPTNLQGPTRPASQQPTPLYVDSLLPISADIDRENTYKLAVSKMGSSPASEGLKIRRDSPSKIQPKEKYLKLTWEEGKEQQEDGFTKELRRMQEQRESKARNQQKMKDQLAREERERLKEKKKEKEEKLSFDYSGLPVKIRNDSKANLISKLINGSMNPKTQLDREAFNDPNPSTVDSVVLGRKKNSLAAIKKKDQVQFQQNRSLSEGVSVSAGVKYTYEGKTLQLKKKAVSTLQLKKTISTRRLNKEQYERVRSLNGSSLQLGPSQSDFRQTAHKHSKSQAHLKKKGPPVQIQKIIINNQSLREKMLERVNQLMMMQTMREEDNPQAKYEYVGQVDIFNMNYLKNGHAPDSKSERKLENLTTDRSVVLPRLDRTNNSKASLPKERERIKEINTVIYEIRKKFDQKLQY